MFNPSKMRCDEDCRVIGFVNGAEIEGRGLRILNRYIARMQRTTKK